MRYNFFSKISINIIWQKINNVNDLIISSYENSFEVGINMPRGADFQELKKITDKIENIKNIYSLKVEDYIVKYKINDVQFDETRVDFFN